MTHLPFTETRRWLRPAAVRLVLLLVVFFALDLMSGAVLQPLAGIPVLRLILGGALGAAYVATRSLWLPIGIHLAWNVAEAGSSAPLCK